MITPERELDAKVAKLMGLEIQKDQIVFGAPFGAKKKSDDPWDYFIGNTNDPIPPYSTDTASAWAVVEKLRPSLDDVWIQSEKNGWEVKLHSTCEWFVGWSPSLPHAICVAALAYAEGKE